MKLKLIITTLASSLLISPILTAQTLSKTNHEIMTELAPTVDNDRMMASARFENFDYNEPGMTQKGLLYGVSGRFQHDFSIGSTVELNFELLSGRANYVGSTWGGEALTASNQYSVYELESEYYFKNSNSGLSPMVGIGLRGTSQNKESEGDYRREYYYIFAEFGLQYKQPVFKRSTLTFKIQENILANGYNSTYLSDADPNLPDVNLKFTSGNAYKLEIELDVPVRSSEASKNQWQIVLNYTSWSIQRSESAEVGNSMLVYEPANQTYLTGLNVGYLF